VLKPLAVSVIALVLVGCSDQLENENAALKSQNHSLSESRKSEETRIATLATNVTELEEKIRSLQSSHQEQIGEQQRTIASLTAENVRQKGDIENLRRDLADEKALFVRYKEDIAQQLQKPGRVKVTLVYKTDATSANVPDNDASVSLHLIKDTTVVYRAVTGADGVAVLDRIKPGKYLCVIHSGNAHQRMRPGGAELVRQHIWKTDCSMLRTYLDDAQIKLLDHDLSDSDASGHFLEALLAKTLVREIEVAPQDQVNINYDFGQGAF
jgi:TolA-binding protein